MMLMPCEDLKGPDQRRRSVGLGPIASSRSLFEDQNGGKPIRQLGPDDWD